MEQTNKTHKSLQLYMRTVHRVLGYLAIGMVFVYALSGITLIHRTGDFMKSANEVTVTLPADLSADQLAAELRIKNLNVSQETDQAIIFADGKYDKTTGQTTYMKKELVWPMNRMVDLHKLPDAKNPHVALVTTIFGIVLFLLAITSLFMYKPKSKQFKANMIYTAIGVAVTIILVVLS